MTRALGVFTSKPYVHSVCWHELYEPVPPMIANARAADNRFDGLLDAGGAPKPALSRLVELRQAVREKRTPLSLGEVSA
jgi:hypothetical protein